MTLQEKVKAIKKSIREMEMVDFENMLERNGYNYIQSVEETLFYQSVMEVSELYVRDHFDKDVMFDNNDMRSFAA